MIRIHYSNRLEELVGALATRLPPPGDRAALFDGPWVVVPSRPLELFVDLELARHRGISGNVETLSVRGVFARLCARDLPELVLIERGHIVAELLAALSSTAVLEAAALAPFARYLLGAGPAEEAVDRRRVELAQGLGALLDDWPLTRPERIAAWRATRQGKADDFSPFALGPLARGPLARAERALWTELFDPAGRFARRGRAEGRRYVTLDDVLGEDLDARWHPPAAVHLFGLSGVPRGLQLALSRLAVRTEVELYVVNPCREFWEDVNTRRRRSSAPAPTPPPAASRNAPRSPTSQVARRRRTTTGGGPAGSTAGPRQLELGGLFGGARVEPPVGETPGVLTGNHVDTSDEDNPFLGVWGHAGRESTRLLNQLSDGDFDATFVDPIRAGDLDRASATDTLLRLVQQDILDRRPSRRAGAASGGGGDESLQILGAPNPRRELESIAAQIWSMVRTDAEARPEPSSPLRFSDVAVLIAGSDEPYLSLARAVFREAHDLPHSIVDQRISDTSPLIEVVLALLQLPLGQLTRREVLDVITHPNVLARFPDADPGLWLRLCEGLAIVHGSDRAAHAGTYIEGDLFNWDQGLKRLALGLFARGPRSGAEHPVPLPTTSRADDAATAAHDDETGSAPNTDPETDTDSGYTPAELPTDARAAANCLGLLARSLLADARFARSARLSVDDWMRFVRALVAAYTVPVTADDESARLRVHAVVDQLAAEADRDLPVALGTALELLRAALTGLRSTRGQILGAGVAVGTLAALRSVPFRVIFVAGLGRERFPAAEHPSPLELDPEQLRAGDVTGRQEDRYLFLEALLAARDTLVLSYVDRDPVSGEPEEPSPLILELVDQLERGYLDREGPSGASGASGTMIRRIPLHRDDDPRVLSAFPAAAAEARARVLGEGLRDAVPHLGHLGIPEIVGALSPATRQALAPLLGTIDLRREEEGENTGAGGTRARRGDQTPAPVRPRVLQLSDLRRFLECPLQGSARIYLGLRDLPDDTEARETGDEPFGVPRWLERRLLGEVLVRAWSGSDLPDLATLEAGYDAALGRPGYGRLLPAGLFRANVRRYHLEILEQWVGALTPANGASEANEASRASLASLDGPRGPLRRVCFGRPEPFAGPAERRAPICLTIDVPGQGPTPVELHGETEPQIWFGAQAAGSLVLSPSTSSDRERSDKDSLRAFIDHVALAASRPEGDPPAALFKGALCRPSREPRPSPASPISFAPLDRLRARSYLSALVGEILGGVHDYLFPCEAVFRSWDQQMSLCDRIDQVRADKFYRERCSSSHGPVADPFEYPTPSAERAARYADARFGLLYRERQEPRPKSKVGRA